MNVKIELIRNSKLINHPTHTVPFGLAINNTNVPILTKEFELCPPVSEGYPKYLRVVQGFQGYREGVRATQRV